MTGPPNKALAARPPSAELIVIAEAGVNHNGDLGRALEMVKAAADAGADFIKFQAFETDSLVARGTKTAAYQRTNTGRSDQAEMLRSLEMSADAFLNIAKACEQNGIRFLCTAFDETMIDKFVSFGMDRIKIASGELTSLATLRRFAALGLPVYLSTGMATLAEVREAIEVLRDGGAPEIIALQCTSLYPAPIETLNLRAMQTMREEFGIAVGFSDHSLGDHAAIAAVALGAVVIEKHFTLDRTLPGPDHAASLEPRELKAMISRLRDVSKMLGDGVKAPCPAETETAAVARRSWHATRDLPAGAVLTDADMALKRPASGIGGAQSLTGRRLVRAVQAETPFTLADFGQETGPQE